MHHTGPGRKIVPVLLRIAISISRNSDFLDFRKHACIFLLPGKVSTQRDSPNCPFIEIIITSGTKIVRIIPTLPVRVLHHPSSIPFERTVDKQVYDILPLIIRIVQIKIELILPDIHGGTSITATRPSKTAIAVQGQIHTAQSDFSCTDINQPGASRRIVACGRLGYQVYLISISCRSRFQQTHQFISRKISRLAIHQNRCTALSVQQNIAIGIYHDSRQGSKNIIKTARTLSDRCIHPITCFTGRYFYQREFSSYHNFFQTLVGNRILLRPNHQRHTQ